MTTAADPESSGSARGPRRRCQTGGDPLAATERFGRDGYEGTKWADVAHDIGVGRTALYHYFESKQHCLIVINGPGGGRFRADFEARRTTDEAQVAIRETLDDTFELDDPAVMTNRLIGAEQGLLSTPPRPPAGGPGATSSSPAHSFCSASATLRREEKNGNHP